MNLLRQCSDRNNMEKVIKINFFFINNYYYNKNNNYY